MDGRTVAQPKPRQNDVHVNAVADLLFVDIQLCVPASRHVERGCPRKISLIWFFVGLSDGGKS